MLTSEHPFPINAGAVLTLFLWRRGAQLPADAIHAQPDNNTIKQLRIVRDALREIFRGDFSEASLRFA